MARIRVIGGVGDLAADCQKVATDAGTQMRRVVRTNVKQGNSLARKYAKAGAGPHGIHYFKRLSAEMTGPLVGEYGPTGVPKSDFVGVGFRSGDNTDLPRSADVQIERMAADVRKLSERLFW